jgi:tetratricopeptide (TPR) repeat protein
VGLLLAGHVLAAAQNDTAFANHLMRERDYFRAITEYKKIEFYTTSDAVREFSRLQIGKSYYRSAKYKSSIRSLARLINETDPYSHVQSESYLYLGLNYYRMGVWPTAEYYWQQMKDSSGQTAPYFALLHAERSDWQTARRVLEGVRGWAGVAETFSHGERLPRRSPLISGILSTLVPGLGQVYSRHAYDGLQAFLFVGAFGFASYMAYRYDSKFNKNYVTTSVAVGITGVFHLANVIGATKTAAYYNRRQKELFLNPIRDQILLSSETD